MEPVLTVFDGKVAIFGQKVVIIGPKSVILADFSDFLAVSVNPGLSEQGFGWLRQPRFLSRNGSFWPPSRSRPAGSGGFRQKIGYFHKIGQKPVKTVKFRLVVIGFS